MKSDVVHARIQSSVKSDSEKILKIIGISISQAIDLFLRQVILKKGLPFKLDSLVPIIIPSSSKTYDLEYSSSLLLFSLLSE